MNCLSLRVVAHNRVLNKQQWIPNPRFQAFGRQGLLLFILVLTPTWVTLADTSAELLELKVELDKLSSDLGYYTSRDTTLEEKETYVERILKLRTQIQNSRLEAAAQPIRKLQLVLSEVRVNGRHSNKIGAVKQSSICLLHPSQRSSGCMKDGYSQRLHWTTLYSFDAYPKRIVLGEPFSITTSSKISLEASSRRRCESGSSESRLLRASTRSGSRSQLTSTKVTLPCGVTTATGSFTQTIKMVPEKTVMHSNYDSSSIPRYFYYSSMHKHTGSEPVRNGSNPISIFETHARLVLDSDGFAVPPLPDYSTYDADQTFTLEIKGLDGSSNSGSIELIYRIATLGDLPIQPRVQNMPPSGKFSADRISEISAKKKNTDVNTGNGSEYFNPQTLNGIGLAQAMERLKEKPTELIAIKAPSEAVSETIKSAYWDKSGQTIVIEVFNRFVPEIVVPSVESLPFAEAMSKLKSAGLTPSAIVDFAAPNAKQVHSIRKIHPPAGTVVVPGSNVQVMVYGKTKDEGVVVPTVTTLPVQRAIETLRQAGFGYTISEGPFTRSAKLANSVLKVVPSEGTTMVEGSKVQLVVYRERSSSYQMPNILNMTVAKAKAMLPPGFWISTRVGDRPPPSNNQAYKIYDQSPKKGARLTDQQEVSVLIHGVYQSSISYVPISSDNIKSGKQTDEFKATETNKPGVARSKTATERWYLGVFELIIFSEAPNGQIAEYRARAVPGTNRKEFKGLGQHIIYGFFNGDTLEGIWEKPLSSHPCTRPKHPAKSKSWGEVKIRRIKSTKKGISDKLVGEWRYCDSNFGRNMKSKNGGWYKVYGKVLN